MKKRPLQKDDLVIRLSEAGKTRPQISALTGIDIRTIGRIRQAHGFKVQKQPLLERFMSHVIPQPSGCWHWNSTLHNTNGRPVFIVSHGKPQMAARWILGHKIGRPVEKGLHTSHLCGNPQCINPDHLIEEIPAANYRRERLNPEQLVKARLPRAHILEIRTMAWSGSSWTEIQERFPQYSLRAICNCGRTAPVLERIAEKTDSEGLWTGRIHGTGYPKIRDDDGRNRPVHIILAERFYGPRPRGMVIRHLNDNKLDIRIENLRYGTQAENAADRIRNLTK